MKLDISISIQETSCILVTSCVVEFVIAVLNSWVTNSIGIVKDSHNIGGEVRHVFSNEERKMTKFVFFLENDLVLELSSGPDGVFWNGNQIGGARENTDWEFDVAHFILRSITETVSINVSLNTTIIKSLEFLFLKRNGLPVVNPVSITSSGWSESDHVQESIVVVNGWVGVDEHTVKCVTDFTIELCTKPLGRSRSGFTEWNNVVLVSKLKS